MSGATCKVSSCQAGKLAELKPLLDVSGVASGSALSPEIEVKRFQGLKKDVANVRMKAIMRIPYSALESAGDRVELMWFVDGSGNVLACRGYDYDSDTPSQEAPPTLKYVEIFSPDADLGAVRLVPRVFYTKSGLWQGEAFTLGKVGKV